MTFGIRGQRYPITYEGGKTEWQRLTKRAASKNFVCMTSATRPRRGFYARQATFQTVRRALNHRDISTTSRYAHVADAEVAEASQRVAEKSPRDPGPDTSTI